MSEEMNCAPTRECRCACHNDFVKMSHVVACCNGGRLMGIAKYGTGQIIGPDDEGVKKEAANVEWTDKDTVELEQENEE